MSATAKTQPERELTGLSLRHLRFGWWALLIFLTLGIVLESLHGFKIGWYLNVSNHTRRLMWTLAHAHGTLLALVHIAFGVSVRFLPAWNARPRAIAAACLCAAAILLPGGFFLGGLVIYAGDPGVGILLVPVGAIFLLAGVFMTAAAVKLEAANLRTLSYLESHPEAPLPPRPIASVGGPSRK